MHMSNQQRLRSACAFIQSDQSLLSWILGYPNSDKKRIADQVQCDGHKTSPHTLP